MEFRPIHVGIYDSNNGTVVCLFETHDQVLAWRDAIAAEADDNERKLTGEAYFENHSQDWFQVDQATIAYTTPSPTDEDGEPMTVAHHKLAAIRARLQGVWDHTALKTYGPMSGSLDADIRSILDQ